MLLHYVKKKTGYYTYREREKVEENQWNNISISTKCIFE